MVNIALHPDVGYRPPLLCRHSNLPDDPIRLSRSIDVSIRVISSQLNRWFLTRRNGWMQRKQLAASERRHSIVSVRVGLDSSNRQDTPQAIFAVCPTTIARKRDCICKTDAISNHMYQERVMTDRQTIQHIARKLPHSTITDVDEIVELLIERWLDQLVQGKDIHIRDIGTLSIEVQNMQVGGAILKNMTGIPPKTVKRIYGRFRPAKYLKREMMGEQDEP
jgi:nucleoid DNA-binding protein